VISCRDDDVGRAEGDRIGAFVGKELIGNIVGASVGIPVYLSGMLGARHDAELLRKCGQDASHCAIRAST